MTRKRRTDFLSALLIGIGIALAAYTVIGFGLYFFIVLATQ